MPKAILIDATACDVREGLRDRRSQGAVCLRRQCER